jgi:type IV secretory pathway VirB10-like protein
MRITAKYALWLLPLLLAGCDHKTKPIAQPQVLAPPIEDTPPPKPATVSKEELPPPVVGEPQPVKPAVDPNAKPVEPPKKPVRHPKKPAATTPATSAPQEAANTPPVPTPSVSAIGQLSGGASGDRKSETEDAINATEKGLTGVTRPLSDAEQKTAAQIRDFLKQAREALATGDVDGAQNLNKKAKVLLAELEQ